MKLSFFTFKVDALLNVFINNPDAIRLEYIKNQIVIKIVKLHSFSRFN